jgi:hypothetical protein
MGVFLQTWLGSRMLAVRAEAVGWPPKMVWTVEDDGVEGTVEAGAVLARHGTQCASG